MSKLSSFSLVSGFSATRKRSFALVPAFAVLSLLPLACGVPPADEETSDEDGDTSSGGDPNGLSPDESGGLSTSSGGSFSETGGAGPAGGANQASGGDTASGGAPSASELVLEEGELGYCSVDGVIEATNSGFSGTGYLNTDNVSGAEIKWSIIVAEASSVTVSFTQANLGVDRPAQLLIDGLPEGNVLSFPSTDTWTNWTVVSDSISLTAGQHTLTLSATSAAGLSNIDNLRLTGEGLSIGSCEEDDEEEPPDGTVPITVWLAGDSTVANGSTPCPSGWGKFFANEFNENVTVRNSAVGGRSVRTWLYDVTTVTGGDTECVRNTDGSGQLVIQARWTDMLSQMTSGDYIFIQFGINDGDSACPRHVGGTAFKQEYAMMANAALAKGVKPVFLTPVSAIKCSGSNAVATRGFLTETFDVGAAEGVPVIDLHQLSINLYQSLAFCPVPGGDVSSGTTGPVGDFFCDDHTHFSDVGAAQIAGLVAQALEDEGLSLAAYLK